MRPPCGGNPSGFRPTSSSSFCWKSMVTNSLLNRQPDNGLRVCRRPANNGLNGSCPSRRADASAWRTASLTRDDESSACESGWFSGSATLGFTGRCFNLCPVPADGNWRPASPPRRANPSKVLKLPQGTHLRRSKHLGNQVSILGTLKPTPNLWLIDHP